MGLAGRDSGLVKRTPSLPLWVGIEMRIVRSHICVSDIEDLYNRWDLLCACIICD